MTDPVEVGFSCAGPGLVVELLNESQGEGWNSARSSCSREGGCDTLVCEDETSKRWGEGRKEGR